MIAAPQQQIEEGFTNEAGSVRYPYDARVVPLPEIKASRESSLRSRQYLKAFLSAPIGCATACTHQALAFRGAIDLLPEDCRRILLVIDEAHHAPAEGLGSLIDEFERRGGHLHFYSATPWRQDGQRVVRPEMRVIRRSLPQHMAEGYAPGHLVHQIRVLGKPGEASSSAEFHGEKVSARFESLLVEALVDQLFVDHQPKTIIRVPPVSGGSGRLVERIVAAFHARGIRTLDATGVGGDKQTTFLNALREERGRTYTDSRFDVIIGIQRVLGPPWLRLMIWSISKAMFDACWWRRQYSQRPPTRSRGYPAARMGKLMDKVVKREGRDNGLFEDDMYPTVKLSRLMVEEMVRAKRGGER